MHCLRFAHELKWKNSKYLTSFVFLKQVVSISWFSTALCVVRLHFFLFWIELRMLFDYTVSIFHVEGRSECFFLCFAWGTLNAIFFWGWKIWINSCVRLLQTGSKMTEPSKVIHVRNVGHEISEVYLYLFFMHAYAHS